MTDWPNVCLVYTCEDPPGPNGHFCTAHWATIPREVQERLRKSVFGNAPPAEYFEAVRIAREYALGLR